MADVTYSDPISRARRERELLKLARAAKLRRAARKRNRRRAERIR